MDFRDSIKKLYKEYCEDEEIGFSEKEFSEFFDFLSIDLYDWFKENANYFFAQKAEKLKKKQNVPGEKNINH